MAAKSSRSSKNKSITFLRDKLLTIDKLDLDSLTFGVVTTSGLEHDSVYEEVVELLKTIGSRVDASYALAKDSAKEESGALAWNKLMEKFGGNIADALAHMGLDTNFNFVKSSNSSSESGSNDDDSVDDMSDASSSELDSISESGSESQSHSGYQGNQHQYSGHHDRNNF